MDIELFDKPRSEWERTIDEWVFNERSRQILKRRLLDGITLERLAEEFDISVAQTKRIINRGLFIICKKMSCICLSWFLIPQK